MRKKNYKGRCEKQTLEKFVTICKTYEPIQTAYAILNLIMVGMDLILYFRNKQLDKKSELND